MNVLSNPEICQKLAEFGITKEKLETGKNLGNYDKTTIKKLRKEAGKDFNTFFVDLIKNDK